MKIFDSHLHLFSRKIIENVVRLETLCTLLDLQTEGATDRQEFQGLAESMASSGVEAGLVLPTSSASEVARVNTTAMEKVSGQDHLYTAGTLHPDFPDNTGELDRLYENGIRAIKMCSFSQGFVLDGPQALAMFDLIQEYNRSGDYKFFIVLDTLYLAAEHFGSNPAFTTTPAKLGALARRYPDIRFIGAHMGGLGAPFSEVREHLIACGNFFLDTSNGAHTLTEAQFVELLKRFGPEHIVFGTDWPWFTHASEIERIDRLTTAAGFGASEKAAVFYDNMAALLDIT